MIKRFTLVAIGLMVTIGLGGCASSYVAKDGAAKTMRQYGVVVSDYKLYVRDKLLPEQAQEEVTRVIGQDMVDQMRKQGLSAKLVSVDDFSVALKQYSEFPRGRSGIKDPGSCNLGNLQNLFTQAEIDGLIIVSGNTVLYDFSLLKHLAKETFNVAVRAFTGIYAGGSGPDVVTTMEMSVLNPEGKFVNHYGDYFTYKKGTITLKKGNILDPEKRRELLDIYINNYRSAAGV